MRLSRQIVEINGLWGWEASKAVMRADQKEPGSQELSLIKSLWRRWMEGKVLSRAEGTALDHPRIHLGTAASLPLNPGLSDPITEMYEPKVPGSPRYIFILKRGTA